MDNYFDIAAINLKKTYGTFEALKGVTLKVKKGEFYTLFGPNGAGKTSLIKLLSTLTDPTSGSLEVFGFDAKGQVKNIRAAVGVISHDTYLYENLTAYENISFFANLYGIANIDNKVRSVIDKVGLKTRMHDLVRTFSRGMKQRLTVARALVHDPHILLLDEPYTGLDLNGAQIFGDMLSELKNNQRTILMTTHNIDEGLDLSDRVGILVNGQIVFEGFTKDLEKNDFKELYISHVQSA
ncbi:MAG: ABC transporter ATP-binding protein [Thermodesulfobacteriota bacterium]